MDQFCQAVFPVVSFAALTTLITAAKETISPGKQQCNLSWFEKLTSHNIVRSLSQVRCIRTAMHRLRPQQIKIKFLEKGELNFRNSEKLKTILRMCREKPFFQHAISLDLLVALSRLQQFSKIQQLQRKLCH